VEVGTWRGADGGKWTSWEWTDRFFNVAWRSRTSAGRVADGEAALLNASRAWSVWVRGTASSRSSDDHSDHGSAWVCTTVRWRCRSRQLMVVRVSTTLYVTRSSLEARGMTWAAGQCRRILRVGRRPWPGCSGHAKACQKSPLVGLPQVQSGCNDTSRDHLGDVGQ